MDDILSKINWEQCNIFSLYHIFVHDLFRDEYRTRYDKSVLIRVLDEKRNYLVWLS